MKSMGGQTEAVFEVLAYFKTFDESTAETLAFEQLDELNMRKRKGSRKETFVGDYTLIESICRSAAARADARYRNQGLAKADKALKETQKTSALPSLVSKQRLWSLVLSTPATIAGETGTLGQLAALAQKQSVSVKRVQAMGLWHKAHLRTGVELEIVWHKAPRVVQWLKSNGVEPPSELTSRFKANLG